MHTVDDYEICLSIQRALVDCVTPSLRRVSFIKNENFIELYFFYDGDPSEIEEELVGDVSAEVISDFPNYNIDSKILKVDYPKKINPAGRIVYNRYEQ